MTLVQFPYFQRFVDMAAELWAFNPQIVLEVKLALQVVEHERVVYTLLPGEEWYRFVTALQEYVRSQRRPWSVAVYLIVDEEVEPNHVRKTLRLRTLTAMGNTWM